MDQFENFSTISCTKSKLKGGQFDEKNANSCILGPILRASLDTWGGGVCQSAQNYPILKFMNNFLHKIQIQRGSVLWKKLPTHVLKAPFWGPFWKMGGRPIGQQWTDLKISQHFLTQNQNWKGVRFIKKIANSCIWGPTVRAILDKWGCRPIGQNLTDFDF